MCAPREHHGESVFFLTSRCCFCLVLPNRTRREGCHHCLFPSCRWGVHLHLVYGMWYYVFPIVVTGCTVYYQVWCLPSCGWGVVLCVSHLTDGVLVQIFCFPSCGWGVVPSCGVSHHVDGVWYCVFPILQMGCWY